MPRPLTTILLFLSAVCLMLAGTLYWLDTNLLDRDRFTAEAAVALRSPEGREAVAREIWTQLRREVPPVRLLDRSVGEGVIYRFLDRDALEPLFSRSAELIYVSVIAPGSGPVIFDLGDEYPLVLESLLNVDARLLDRVIDFGQLGPVVLVEDGQLPDLSALHEVTGWGSPALIASSVLFGLPGLWRGRRRAWTMATFGFALMGAALLQQGLTPYLRNRMLEPVTDPQIATIMSDAFGRLEPSLIFQSEALIYLGMGLVASNTLILAGRRLFGRGVSRPE